MVAVVAPRAPEKDSVTHQIHRTPAIPGCCRWCGRSRAKLFSYAYAYPEGATRFAGAYCSLVHFFRYYNS